MVKKYCLAVFGMVLLLTSFSVGLAGAQETETTEMSVTFSPDIAGITPDSFWYFLDFTHTPEEAINEAGLMAQKGNIEAAQIALEHFKEEVGKETTTVEAISLDGVTLEDLQSDPEIKQLYEKQADLINYQIYLEAISSSLGEQIVSGEVDAATVEKVVDGANEAIADVGAAVEENRLNVIDEVRANSAVSRFEAEGVFEDGLRGAAETRFSDARFEQIASINDVQVLKDKIFNLREEAAALKETGDTEKLTAVKQLLEMAESHGVFCLHAKEEDLGITSFGHLNAAENLVVNAEKLLNNEVQVSELKEEGLPVTPPTIEELKEGAVQENEVATEFLERYEDLKVQNTDNPVRLEAIEQEKIRADRAQQLAQQISDNGVLDKWVEELRTESRSEEEIQAEIRGRVSTEWDNVYGDEYVPPGLYVLPGDEQQTGGEQLEVIGIGRIERVETIDPETGEVIVEIIGWHDGSRVEDVKEGGGFALGVPYTDPSTGNTYTFGSIGYSYVTEAGVTYTTDYPEEYKPSSEYNYNYGDEVFTFKTPEGDEIVYSTTGYKVEDTETKTAIVEEAYVQESVVFIDGAGLDNEPTGYVFNNDDGKSYVYSYNPETKSYTDSTTGKVYVPPTSASHLENTVYDSATNNYKYNYGGVEWSSSGDGTWTSSTGQRVSLPTVPAPVGYEQAGTYETQSGRQWVYDSTANKWMETTTQSSYYVSPNNQYRYDEENRRYVDASGNRYDSSKTGTGSYNGPWSYDASNKQWVSSETGNKYDPSSGEIFRADGTVVGPENRPAGQGSEEVCYGCYYQGGEETSGQTYTYGGGHYVSTPTGGYSYYTSSGEYQGPTSATDSNTGETWSYDSQTNSWSSSSGQSYTPGSGGYGYASGDSFYRGGGGYDSEGNYVGGDYGNYGSAGEYTGGATYGSYYDSSTGTYSSPEGGTYTDGSTYEGSYPGSYSPPSGSGSGDYSGGSYSGGSTGGTTSGGDAGGGSTGGDSGGGSTGGGDGGGGSGGYVVAEEEAELQGNVVAKFLKWFGCLFSNSC